MMGVTALKILSRISRTKEVAYRLSTKQAFTTNVENSSKNEPTKLGSFAIAFQKQTEEIEAANAPPPTDSRNFATLLRTSKFIDLGDPKGKIVQGDIINIVENDMYIDFGWKFHCVCTRPEKNSEEYVVGAKVRLMINNLELSTRFLGSNTDLTILEADCRLLNLIYSPARR